MTRYRRIAALSSGLALCAAGSWTVVSRTGAPTATASVRVEEPTPEPESSSAPPALRPLDAALGRRGTLGDALDRLVVPPELRAPLLAAVSPRIDARRLPPHTAIRALLDENGSWRAVGVRIEPERYLRIELPTDPTGPLRAEWVALPTSTELRAVSGVIDSSVAQALAHHPHGAFLTLGFADIFQWDVDLLVDPRPGDEVRLVYELRRLGDLPADAPPLSEADRPGAVLEPGRIVAASYSGRVARADAFWIHTEGDEGEYYDRLARPLRKTFLKSPLNYRRISSGFSRARRHPVTRQVVPHHGVDYAAPTGTPVVASADGRVVSAGWDGPLGRAVRIRHGSEFVTVYGHLRGFANGVRAGATVRQNQVIGYVGSSGRATGPHLHYTMIRSGSAIDPLRMENPPAPELPAASLSDLAHALDRLGPLVGVADTVARHGAGTETAPVRSGI